MAQIGISPIEGIGIVGSGSGNWGTGIQFGNDTNPSSYVENYFLDPHNFSVGATLMMQGGTIYGLPFSAGDMVAFDGAPPSTANVWFNNVGVFDSGGRAYINPTGGNLHGTIIGCNGKNTPPSLIP